jgi:hypothetical protein
MQNSLDFLRNALLGGDLSDAVIADLLELIEGARRAWLVPPANPAAGRKRTRAKRLLRSYLTMLANAASFAWSTENDAEVDELVDLLVEAAKEEPAHAPHL